MMSVSNANGGLSHLVEAATVLAQLGGPAQSADIASSEKVQRTVVIEDEDKTVRTKGTHNNKKEIFPQRLMLILSDSSLNDVVTWLPHGRSFVIIRPDVFTEKVLPKYLPAVDARASTKYPSFTRKLNRWGFRQATRGPDTGAFHHPHFRRDMPDLCLKMVCQRSRDRTKVERKSGQPPSSQKGIRKVSPLTKAALDAVSTTGFTDSKKSAAVVSVTDDSRSVDSIPTSSNQSNMGPPASIPTLPQGTISTDSKLVEETLRRRDEQERLQVAKAFLYESYLKAIRGE